MIAGSIHPDEIKVAGTRRVAGKVEVLEKYLGLDFVVGWITNQIEKGEIEVFGL